MAEGATDPMAEITAMKAVAEALGKLDPEATARVVRWAAERFAVGLGGGTRRLSGGGPGDVDSHLGDTGVERFKSLADLYTAASPSTDMDRALVAGYWFQFSQGQEDFAAQTVNSALKDLGHRVANITVAFNNLKSQKPALVVQLKKSGTTRQARKKYKLTTAGKTAVEQLIGHA
jgi:hypothetical protein